MKKIILTVASVFALSFANAQSYTKPSAGSTQVEVTFTPNLSGATMFALPSFYNDKKSDVEGIRVRKFSSDTKAMRYTALLKVNKDGKDAETEFGVALGVGVENHMKGADRLSTYWGYEGNVGFSKDAVKTTTIGVSAQLFTGCDYYIMPNVYLGAEIHYGLSVLNTKPDGGDSDTKFGLNPSLNPSLRLGWRF
jgi:hypothetical protein